MTAGRAPRYTLLVFDLDGTLVDSRLDLATATNAMVEELGGRRLAVHAVAAMVGEGALVLVRRALSAAGLDPATPGALDLFLKHYDRHLLDRTRPYPGMIDALERLRPTRALAVLTNKPSSATVQILAGLGLTPYFRAVLAGDTAAGRKPDPAGLQSIMRATDATPRSTVLVGDSPIDLETARAAGTGVCLARYGFGFRMDPNRFRGDELFIDTPTDLTAVIA